MSAEPKAEPPLPPLRVGWEHERDIERAKVSVRWLATVLIFALAQYTRLHDPEIRQSLPALTLYTGTAAVLLLNLLESAYLFRPGLQTIAPWFKYATVFCDLAFVSFLIHYTGYTQSPFFFVYFMLLISNCLRYGLLMSLYIAGLFNVLYVLTLGLAPPDAVKSSVLGGEGLKILAFWATAFYGGTISARLRRQANQLRVYEETIAELRARLSNKENHETTGN